MVASTMSRQILLQKQWALLEALLRERRAHD